MNGKDKCRILKEIRRQIAAANDIEWVVSECKHQGNCKGTCPKCESEVRKLERALSLRNRLGKAVAVSGVAAACAAGLSACSMEEVIDSGIEILEIIKDSRGEKETELVVDGEIEPYTRGEDELEGDVTMEYPTEEIEMPGEIIEPDVTEELEGYVEYCTPGEKDYE